MSSTNSHGSVAAPMRGADRVRLHCGLLAVLALFLLGGCEGAYVGQSTSQFPPSTGFLQKPLVLNHATYNMWVFVPRDYSPTKKYPAILFLHGLFEQGDSGTKVLGAGLGPVIANDPDHWPFITIFPQSPGSWRGADKDALAMAALNYAQRTWSIDPDRVILAGLSYGGLGTWEIGARHRDRFAALVPVSGLSAEYAVPRLVPLPVWAFAFKSDLWVSSSNSQQMCQAIDASGGRARFTEFSGMGHDAWPAAVYDSQLVTWMLAQHRPSPVQASVQASARVRRNSSHLFPDSARALTLTPVATAGAD